MLNCPVNGTVDATFAGTTVNASSVAPTSGAAVAPSHPAVPSHVRVLSASHHALRAFIMTLVVQRQGHTVSSPSRHTEHTRVPRSAVWPADATDSESPARRRPGPLLRPRRRACTTRKSVVALDGSGDRDRIDHPDHDDGRPPEGTLESGSAGVATGVAPTRPGLPLTISASTGRCESARRKGLAPGVSERAAPEDDVVDPHGDSDRRGGRSVGRVGARGEVDTAQDADAIDVGEHGNVER